MNTKDKIILGVVGVVLAAGAVLASTGVISFGERPQVLFQKMADASHSITSNHFDLTINADITGESAADSGSFTVHAVGATSKEATDPRSDMHIEIKGTEGTATEQLEVAADLRMLDRVFYLKTTKLPAIPFLPTTKILNTWFSIDPVSLAKEFGTNEQALELQSAFGAGARMPREFYDKLYTLVGSERLVSSVVPKGSEMIGDVAANKYDLRIDIKKVPGFLEKYTDVYNTYAPAAGLATLPHKTFTDDEIKALESIELSPVSLWVGKNDSLIYKTVFAVTLHDVSEKLGQDVAGPTGTISFSALLSDYNKPVQVEKPAPVTPIQDLFKSLMGGAILN